VRGSPDTTYQAWDFSSGGPNVPILSPDAIPAFPPGVNPFNPPAQQGLLLAMRPSNPAATFRALFQGRTSVYELGANDSLLFNIPDYNDLDRPLKELRLQVTWFGGAGFSIPVYDVFATFLPDGWVHELTIWNFDRCPLTEEILIRPPANGTLAIDQVVVDTLCSPVPEPGSLVLLTLGSLGLLGYAWRRRQRAA
jgi:hypothetical protein